MIIEFGTLGLKLAQAIGPKLAEIGFKEAMKKFNPSDFEKACIYGIKTADKTYELFYPCAQGVVEDFLKTFLAGAAFSELLKPFNNLGTPQVEFLVAAFNATVAENKRIQDRFMPEKVSDWLEVFARTYFEKTNCYLSFQVAKADYFKPVSDLLKVVGFSNLKT